MLIHQLLHCRLILFSAIYVIHVYIYTHGNNVNRMRVTFYNFFSFALLSGISPYSEYSGTSIGALLRSPFLLQYDNLDMVSKLAEHIRLKSAGFFFTQNLSFSVIC